LNIERLGGQTEVKLGQGNDIVRVNYDRYGKTDLQKPGCKAAIWADYQLDLDGEQGSDFYQIGLSGEGHALIACWNSRCCRQGADRARDQRDQQRDLFLFRANLDPRSQPVSSQHLQLDENGDQVRRYP